MKLSDRDMLIYAALGASVWLSGVLEFLFAGRFLFESGALISALAAIFIAIAVCLIFRTTMRWRKASATQAVTVAVLMVVPGLFGEVVRELLFVPATGLRPDTQSVFAATIFFGNASLLLYATILQRNAQARS